MLPGVTRKGAEHVAALLADIVAGYELRIEEQVARVNASIGVAMLGGLSASELVALADEAMYEAKASERHRVVVAPR